MTHSLNSLVRKLTGINPIERIDDSLFEQEESMPPNGHPMFPIELPCSREDIGKKVIFLGPNPTLSGGIETSHVAYQGSENCCISKVSEHGSAGIARGKICISKNPSLIRTKGVVAPLHFLFVIVPEKKEEKSSAEVQAYSIIPKILYESVRGMMDKKYAILINALPKKYFEDNTIPNSISIPLEENDKLSAEERKENFVKIIREEQLKRPQMLDLEVNEVPLVVFCAHGPADWWCAFLDGRGLSPLRSGPGCAV